MQCGKNLKGKYLLEITHSAKNLNGNPLTYKVFNYLQHLDPLTPKIQILILPTKCQTFSCKMDCRMWFQYHPPADELTCSQTLFMI